MKRICLVRKLRQLMNQSIDLRSNRCRLKTSCMCISPFALYYVSKLPPRTINHMAFHKVETKKEALLCIPISISINSSCFSCYTHNSGHRECSSFQTLLVDSLNQLVDFRGLISFVGSGQPRCKFLHGEQVLLTISPCQL